MTLSELQLQTTFMRVASAIYSFGAALYDMDTSEEGKKQAAYCRAQAADIRKACEEYQYEYVSRPLPGQKKKKGKK